MPPILLDHSIYDRDRHLAVIKELLGEDLWQRKTKPPVPRINFYGPGLIAAIKDGKHQLADSVMQAFVRYWPRSRETEHPLWNDYGIVKHASIRITTVTEFTGYSDESRTHVTAPSVWLQHLFLRRSVLPSYKAEEVFDSVRLDIDVQIGGVTYDLYRLQQADLVRVFAPWVDAIESLRRTVGHFEVEWMLSGRRGFWLSVFFDTGGEEGEALGIRDAIIRAVQGDQGQQGGKPKVCVDDLTYSIDLGNLGDNPCRVPWSMHQDTNNVSVNVNPRTGEPDVLQFVETPFNEGSLSEFSELSPACWDEPTQHMTWAEYSESLRESGQEVRGRSQSDGEFRAKKRGGGVEVRWDDDPFPWLRGFEGSSSNTEHLRWSWEDVIAEADGERRFGDWRDIVIRDAPDGDKWDIIVMGGNLANVARAMKYQYGGRIVWEEIAAEYEAAYIHADWSSGGTIRKWVKDLRRGTRDGATLTPLRPWLSPEDVERCSAFAKALPGVQRRQREDLFHLLLVLRRLSVGRDEFEASEDFTARRSGINAYPTWEEQYETEFDPEDPRFLRRDDGRPLHPRNYPSSVSARRRLTRLLKHICDMEEGRLNPSGRNPWWRREPGSNRLDHPRVIANGGEPVGGLFVVVRDHPFWSGSGA